MSGRVFVVGALHLDVVVDAPHLPALDETVVGHSVTYRLGGKGGNQAVAASLMDARVSFAGLVGMDRFGEQIISELEKSGVDIEQVSIVEGDSGMSVAIKDGNGDYGAVIVSGVNGRIDPDGIAVPDDTGVLLLQNEVSESVNRNILSRINGKTVKILNYAPAAGSHKGNLQCIDILVLNRIECESLAASELKTNDPFICADYLKNLGPTTVVLTLGKEGLVVASENKEAYSLPVRHANVVSTHGAGDFFIGALSAEIVRGADLNSAIEFAQNAAAAFVETPLEARLSLTREKINSLSE